MGSEMCIRDRNRPPGSRGHSHGGVGIAFRESSCTFRQIQIHNPDAFEVLAAVGTVPGHAKKVLVVACYLPPGDSSSRGNGCLDFIEDLIVKLKRRYSDPYIVVGGDYNQWKVEEVIADFVDISEVPVGPTRGSRSIDRTFTNFSSIRDCGTVPPLETKDSRCLLYTSPSPRDS